MNDNKDTRLIFLEAIEPFLTLESKKQVQINIDIIEQRLAVNGYFGALYKRLQEEIEELRSSRDFYKSTLEVIARKEQEAQCDEAEKTADGKCRGYQKSEKDDEPTEMCKQCKQSVFYEE